MNATKQVTPKGGRPSSEQAVLKALAAQPNAIAADVASAAGVGRSTAAKILAGLERSGEVRRSAGGREGGRRLPDRWALAAGGRAPQEPASTGARRLKPGELDGLVLGYLEQHPGEPLGPGAVAKSLQRSSGAVANSLDRLARAERVRQVGERPRRYRIEPDRR